MNNRRNLVAVGFLSALAGAVGCLVVYNLMPEPQELREPLPHHLASSDRQLKTSIYIPGNKVDTLVNGNQIFPSMLGAIREARQTISFETYIYWRGDIAVKFADALSAKAREGLRVKVLLDWVGSLPMDEALIKRMQDAGVEVVRFRPVTWYTLDRVNNRTHRKLLIVDGRVGFTGGVGILPSEAEDILSISPRERHKWLDDGRLQSAGTKTVKLRGRAKAVTFHVFTPGFIEHVLDSGSAEIWREEDVVTAAENRRRAAGKAALTRAGKQAGKSRNKSPDPDGGISPDLAGWDEFQAEGLLR